MRSEQIHRAITQGNNRFEICQLVAKGVRLGHRSGTRFEDSIGEVLGHLGHHKASIIRSPLPEIQVVMTPLIEA